jgi:hypothetical protein
LVKIYTQEEIDKAKASPSFEREYNLKYLGLIGNVFHTKDIEAAIQKGTGYSPDEINSFSQKSMGIDLNTHISCYVQCCTASRCESVIN